MILECGDLERALRTRELMPDMRAHAERCAECRAVLAEFIEIDSELTGWGQRLGRENPPPAGAREQLAARLGSRPVRRG